jgi:transposase InsO family protein
VRPSMGSVGDAYDNAMCESFFATLEGAGAPLIEKVRFAEDSPLEEAVMSEPVSWPNSLLAGKIRGILFVWASEGGETLQIWKQHQSITKKFPTRPSREFFAALQGIKSGDQGTCRPDQGKLFWSPVRSRKREVAIH